MRPTLYMMIAATMISLPAAHAGDVAMEELAISHEGFQRSSASKQQRDLEAHAEKTGVAQSFRTSDGSSTAQTGDPEWKYVPVRRF